MSLHDMVIANADGATVRADINNAFAAIVSNFSSATAPAGANLFALMWWYDTANNKLMQRNEANTAWLTRYDDNATYPYYPLKYIKLSHAESSTINGGTATSGSYQTRVINTEDNDADAEVTISSNVITFTNGGTFRCNILTPCYRVNAFRSRLRQTGAGATTLLVGTNGYNNTAGSYAQTFSVIVGEFTVPAAATVEIQTQVNTTKATDGYGVASGFTGSEIYTVAEFWKVADV